MDFEVDLERDRMATHLSELMRAACADSQAAALLLDLPPGIEGYIEIVNGHPYAMIAVSLDLVPAEAAVLHEAGHWLLGHEDEPERSLIAAARAANKSDGTFSHGPWERAADQRGLELLLDPSVATLLTGSTADVSSYLIQGAQQYE